MQYFPPALEKLTEQFARLPGIGNKSAQRLAFFVLSLPDEDAQAFADAIVTAKRAAATSGTAERYVWWPIPRMSSPWSGPGSIRGATMCSTGSFLP